MPNRSIVLIFGKIIQPIHMKKLILTAFFAFGLISLSAQEADSVVIRKEGSLGFNFANVGLSNWAAGGENSISLGTVYYTKYTKVKGPVKWVHQVDFNLGGAKVGEQSFRKTDDNVILASAYSHKFKPKWAYSAVGIFRTQLLIGNNFAADPNNPGGEIATKISNFMAPGYLNINLGLTYDLNDKFTAQLAPAAGKITFVMDDELAARGDFGVTPGENIRYEFGNNILLRLNLPIAENITFKGSANFFTNYETFGNVDTNLDMLLVAKVNSWFNASAGLTLIYDDDILIDQGDGTSSREIQFKHVINMGLNFILFQK